MVIRPDGLQIIEVDIEFNYLKYSKLEIDLHHINREKKFTRETNFSAKEIFILVTVFLDGEVLELNAQEVYGDESCDYYSVTKSYEDNIYKLVFCICTDRRDSLGIMTLHRLRR